MKYFCLGSAIALIKTHYSDSLVANMPFFGTPIFNKLPMTQSRMKYVYDESERFVLCKTLEDANELRRLRNEFYERNHPGVSSTLGPLRDYAIYEVEVDDNIDDRFSLLADTNKTQSEVEELVDIGDFFRAYNIRQNRASLPDINVYQVQKSELNMRLITSHYLSLVDGRNEIEAESMCRIL